MKKAYLCNIMERQAINSAIINYLSSYRPERIGVFGSFARQEENMDSDIDILVKFKDTISLLELVRINRELSDLLGKKVDLITEQSLKNERIKKYILKDLQIIFE
jgi:predicted nucleotidyltransferase